MSQKLVHYAITHGGIRKVFHPRLKTEIDNQTAVKYLRFIQPVKIETLELPRAVYGRWAPNVPTHPAHLLISIPDLTNKRWKLIKEVDLPYDPRTAGEGARQEQSLEAMEEFFASILNDPPYRIDLGGLETDILRIECDREHPAWPSHGEMNGSPYSVPFGILDPLKVFGAGEPPYKKPFRYNPGLQSIEIHPSAPRGMTLSQTPLGISFESPKLSIGFSLKRPMLTHLGWDILGQGQSRSNRIKADWAIGIGALVGGLSGPLLKTFYQDFGAQFWGGEIAVRGNIVDYRNLLATEGLVIDARFTIEPDAVLLELTQNCTQEIPLLEAETWRFAWDLRQGMTATSAVPESSAGRNGRVSFPIAWASDGNGCLVCQPVHDAAEPWLAQVESYRSASVNTCGFTPGKGPGNDDLLFTPLGQKRLELQLSLDAFEPILLNQENRPGDGLQRHWGSVFSCFRSEHRGFSNNAASANCHVSHIAPVDIASVTHKLNCGLDPAELSRFTLKRALLDGGGYGYWRNLYLDSDPALLIATGRTHQASPDLAWLHSVEPGLRETANRILNIMGAEGLILCRDLSGNSGSYRWSCNSMDVVGFGHLDGYVNAIGYRALRNAAALFKDLGDAALGKRCGDAAARIKEAYAKVFINPETGWLAGWKSRDGQLHDYGFIWVNGPAIAFGLLDESTARQALLNLEAARARAGITEGYFGLPSNLLPLSAEDHMMPIIWGVPQPTFENYTDGGLYGFHANYYLRSLTLYGLKEQARKLARELDEGLAAGYFNGGLGMGNEFRSWEGLRTGYEGTLIGSFGPVYSVAVEQGLIAPPDPEWWPAGG